MSSTSLTYGVVVPGGGTRPVNLRQNPGTNQARLVRVRCSSSTPRPLDICLSRRSASIALLLFHCCFSYPNRADAGGLFDKYVKRKKLDPLEAYVPAVLLTQSQFKYLEKSLGLEQPKYDISRSLLRSGPAASLRINIRAVAQYAADNGRGKAASDAVDQCLSALEDLDSLLLHASRKDPTASVESMRKKISIAQVALDRLLQTVPPAVLDRGKAMADAYEMPSASKEETRPQDLNPDMKELDAIL